MTKRKKAVRQINKVRKALRQQWEANGGSMREQLFGEDPPPAPLTEGRSWRKSWFSTVKGLEQ